MAIKNIKTHSKKKKARAFFDNQQLPQALELYIRVCEIDCRDADAWYMAGAIYGMLGQKNKSIQFLYTAIELRPGHLLARYNLGIALRDNGDFSQAERVFKKLTQLKVDYIAAYNALAHIQIRLKKLAQAADTFRKVIQLKPCAEAWVNLGTVCQAKGQLDEAADSFRQAIKLSPGMMAAWSSLCSVLVARGEYTASLEAYRCAVELDSANAEQHSNLLLTLNYIESLSPAEVFAEHLRWGKRCTNKAWLRTDVLNAEPYRPLRIGYISADFRAHSVAYFIEPLLAQHNTSQYETWCYSSVPLADETTARLKSLAFRWCDISKYSTAEVAAQISKDKIDILLDLSGHTSANHLAVFMKKPAAIQITWLGYPNTTGMACMDYRLVDETTDPAGYEQFCSETLIRIKGCFLCFKPPETAPEPDPLAYKKNNYITFGSFNNLAKIGANVIKLWADILTAVPGARLIIKNHSLSDTSSRQRLLTSFAEHGVSAQRIELLGTTESQYSHLNLYKRIDIALDTFPYNGTTTSCEALWMGVPVICKLGDRHASRVSASLLKNINLAQCLAKNEQEYLFIASELAADSGRLSELRSSMRQRMRTSVLCDAKGFAQKVEAIYREIWQKHCAQSRAN
jgi:predicted O-linked N-acetylglucosamine transferase (SPINDLY family)